jgi:hypothetical protein
MRPQGHRLRRAEARLAESVDPLYFALSQPTGVWLSEHRVALNYAHPAHNVSPSSEAPVHGPARPRERVRTN